MYYITMPVLVFIQTTRSNQEREPVYINVTKHNNYNSYVFTITTMYLKECGLLLNELFYYRLAISSLIEISQVASYS